QLIQHFVEKYGKRYGRTVEIPPVVMVRFLSYDWPGNIRELENLVRRLMVLRDPSYVLAELRDRAPAPGQVASLATPSQQMPHMVRPAMGGMGGPGTIGGGGVPGAIGMPTGNANFVPTAIPVGGPVHGPLTGHAPSSLIGTPGMGLPPQLPMGIMGAMAGM